MSARTHHLVMKRCGSARPPLRLVCLISRTPHLVLPYPAPGLCFTYLRFPALSSLTCVSSHSPKHSTYALASSDSQLVLIGGVSEQPQQTAACTSHLSHSSVAYSRDSMTQQCRLQARFHDAAVDGRGNRPVAPMLCMQGKQTKHSDNCSIGYPIIRAMCMVDSWGYSHR